MQPFRVWVPEEIRFGPTNRYALNQRINYIKKAICSNVSRVFFLRKKMKRHLEEATTQSEPKKFKTKCEDVSKAGLFAFKSLTSPVIQVCPRRKCAPVVPNQTAPLCRFALAVGLGFVKRTYNRFLTTCSWTWFRAKTLVLQCTSAQSHYSSSTTPLVFLSQVHLTRFVYFRANQPIPPASLTLYRSSFACYPNKDDQRHDWTDSGWHSFVER